MINIPTFQLTSSDFIQKVTLNNQVVTIRIKYNVRSFCFHMDFTDQDGNVLTGIKMVTNWPLLKAHKTVLNFSGDIILLPTDTNVDSRLTYENLNTGWGLMYITPEEYEDWRLANGL